MQSVFIIEKIKLTKIKSALPHCGDRYTQIPLLYRFMIKKYLVLVKFSAFDLDYIDESIFSI